MRGVHDRLRDALQVTREAVASGAPAGSATHDLLLHCHGFCSALTSHHEGEDSQLFPAIAAAHPRLRTTLRSLANDHTMIAELVAALQKATEQRVAARELERHLDGIAAIMESHFGFEERRLLTVLDTLDLHADVRSVFGSG